MVPISLMTGRQTGQDGSRCERGLGECWVDLVAEHRMAGAREALRYAVGMSNGCRAIGAPRRTGIMVRRSADGFAPTEDGGHVAEAMQIPIQR